MLADKQRSEHMLLKTNEALMTYTAELKRIKKVLFAASNQTENNDDVSSEGKDKRSESEKNQSMDAIIKRLVKYKDDNKKLKLILK